MKTVNLFISVITPVYNDPEGLADTLQSLVKQDYPQDSFEIIVADNGSIDETLDVAKRFLQEYPKLMEIVIESEIQSSYAARNKGIKAAKGEIIAFIDADMSVEKDWLTKVSSSIDRYDAYYLSCKVDLFSESNSLSASYNKLSGFPIEEYINNRHFAPTCCLIVRKKVFDDIGFFDSNLISSGDYEFGNRVYNSGYKLHYDSDIVMKHPARTSYKQLMKKSFRIGRGFYQLSYYYPDIYKKMNQNIASSLSGKSNKTWSFFTFKKDNEAWNNISAISKSTLYIIDITNKLIKPIGYFYEKYFKIRSR
ncbi:glycosyltransferase [Methanolobus halotolerans]|uniref:Glycosyltransferase AglI n=1 Tax=Methanolobus halotolerans TaxID=2052935 RepID=A0A4E0Q3J2_9EURY|nr:glycosyltransferase [Methanolobus halotolerans]TGC08021.1 glycosyltransferase AglI [Methanolobus halotolerans]